MAKLIGQKQAILSLEASSNDIARELMIVTDAFVVTATPVDEGTAKANWLASIDTPSARTVDTAGQQLANYPKGLKGAHRYYLVNNLPYIDALNKGSSPQQGPKWVEAAFRRAERKIKRRFS